MHPIETLPDAMLQAHGPIAEQFLQQGPKTFHEACRWTKNLPYAANSNSEDSSILFEEGCGNCTTKYGAIARLASLSRVKHLSRDLEYCLSNDGSYSLSAKDFEILSNWPNEEFNDKLFQLIPSCESITSYLIENIDSARRAGNSRKKIRRALAEGQSDIR